ncbi:DUF6695 family protein [Aestuariivivens sediminis]|uniref:DUF6695 family protein n=1 Tax=Aestuariivivens sediminis TaxID=2913557 RepID=UPI001F58E330|nr:DUF6695 family protein [Aestuariivivens sediminis]
MSKSGIILTLAYPETIVMVSKEWFSPFLKYFGIGKRNYVRAGHAALVLIDKETGLLEYHDFGRYITPEPTGRVRGKDTDSELDFPITAKIENGVIKNLDDILKFLATNPKLTHGDGKLIASVCSAVDYQKARIHITGMQNKHFIRYAAFLKDACNCARFVTDSLIASVTDLSLKQKLKKLKWFTPSTIGNVILADTENYIYEVSQSGIISEFRGSQKSENLRCFLDKLKTYEPHFVGTLEPRMIENLHEKAQWLSGIAAGAWFELHHIGHDVAYRFKRISPYGNIDVYDSYQVNNPSFNYNLDFEFIHYSNCKFFHVKQNGKIFRFDRKREG